MPTAGSRKRPAPRVSSIVQQQQAKASKVKKDSSQMATDQYLQWHQQSMANSAASYPDSSGNFGSNIYNGMNQGQAVPPVTSNQLARRPMSQHLVSRANYNITGDDAWPIISEDGVQNPQDQAWLNNNDELEQKAEIARRETQAKRKSIPPFVQKLTRYVRIDFR